MGILLVLGVIYEECLVLNLNHLIKKSPPDALSAGQDVVNAMLMYPSLLELIAIYFDNK